MDGLLDDDGENRAVRSFLMQYSCDRSITVGQMRDHMARSGWRGGYFPTFAQGCAAATHLTKAGAQIWVRHLFAMENRAAPADLDAEGLPPLPIASARWYVQGRYRRASVLPGKGEPLFTAEQFRQGQRDAIEADRRAREVVKYRLLDTRDIIESTDEWLAADSATWAVNPSALFYGAPYCSFMLPARRKVSESGRAPVSADQAETK